MKDERPLTQADIDSLRDKWKRFMPLPEPPKQRKSPKTKIPQKRGPKNGLLDSLDEHERRIYWAGYMRGFEAKPVRRERR